MPERAKLGAEDSYHVFERRLPDRIMIFWLKPEAKLHLANSPLEKQKGRAAAISLVPLSRHGVADVVMAIQLVGVDPNMPLRHIESNSGVYQ
jgi:hypothetical protein